MNTPFLKFLYGSLKKILCFLIALHLIVISIAQENKVPDWWTPILTKHDLNQNSYILREKCCILGNMTTEKTLEVFINAIVIINGGQGQYYVYRSKKVTFETVHRILRVYDGLCEVYLNKGIKPILLKSYEHVNYLHDFKKHYATTNQKN